MYSQEHLTFLKKLKKKNRQVKLTQLLILLLFLIIWQLAANFNLINTVYLIKSKKHLRNDLWTHEKW